MTMPLQKPGKSKQDYGTPRDLIAAVEWRWGKLHVDLAARADNTKCELFISPERDSLSVPWCDFSKEPLWGGHPLCWLNPPFEDLGAWAKKCKEESAKGARIVMLTPASIGAEWFADYCEHHAKVVALRPRITFEGCKDSYPKDCMLTLWGMGPPSFETWRYK